MLRSLTVSWAVGWKNMFRIWEKVKGEQGNFINTMISLMAEDDDASIQGLKTKIVIKATAVVRFTFHNKT